MDSLIIFLAEYPIYIATVFAILYVVVKPRQHHHLRHIAIVIFSVLSSWYISTLLKKLINHPRPDITQALFVPSDIYSFPSGHATFMFGLAFAMYSFDKKVGLILFALAVITGITRVLGGVHYWYDVLGGFFIAAGVVHVILLLTKRIRS